MFRFCLTNIIFALAACLSPPAADAQSQPQSQASPPILSQVEPLPPVFVAELPPPNAALPASTPLVDETLYENFDQPSEPRSLPGARDGVFQKLTLTETWLAPSGGDSAFGVHTLGTAATFGFPLPTRESPLLVRPSFELHLFDGPAARDVPPQVFDANVQFRWIKPLNERWIFDLAVAPGYAADFNASSSDAVRVTGHGIAIWNRSETTKVILGVAYVDRGDIRIVPAAGVVYTPHDDVSYELVFPRPRVAWRPHGWFGEDDWLYLAGEFGGGTWAVERAGGGDDLLEYSDYRFVLGFERKTPLALQPLAEIGYVFGRQLEYESSSRDFHPDDTLMLRFGLTY